MLRLGYNQASDLAYWWFDGYADFNDMQTPRVRAALAQWFAWNRATQLPEYADALARSQTEVLVNTTPERVCEVAAEWRGRIDSAVDRAVPPGAELMLTLTRAQLQHIERRYAKSNEEFRSDYLQSDPADRIKESVKRTVDRVEMLYGRLDDAQLASIKRSMMLSPFDPELWLAERQRRQQDLLQMLRKLLADRAAPEQARTALRAHIKQYERSPRELYRTYNERLWTYNCAFGAALHNSMTTTQRRTAVERLKGWESDLRVLTADNVK